MNNSVNMCECRKLHYGSVNTDMKVVHKNGIGVDCRLDNLMLVSHQSSRESPSCDVNIETDVYWRALQHVIVNPVFELAVRMVLSFQ